MKYNLKMTGTLVSLSPITVVPPGAEEISVGAQKYKKVANTILYEDGLRQNRPIIPGSTLRGALRRAAMKSVIMASGKRVSLSDWHLNAVGGIKGAEAEGGFDVVMRDTIRNKNPILSLFGAGSPWLNSRVSISNAVPQHAVETVIVGGVRADDGRRDNTFFQNVDDKAQDEWLALTGENSERTSAKKAIASLKADLRKAKKDKNDAEVARIDAELKSLTTDEKTAKTMSTNPVSMPLTHEAIPAGVVFNHEIKFSAVTLEEIGLFFIALNTFLNTNPVIGQHANIGYGMANMTYNLSASKVEAFDPFKIGVADMEAVGTLTGAPYEGIVNVPDFITTAIEAFKTAFENGTFDFSEIVKPKKAKADKNADEATTPTVKTRQTDMDMKSVFAEDGILASALTKLGRKSNTRKVQVTYASLVANAVEKKSPAFLDAETGVGKTLGYLAPVALKAFENRKDRPLVVVSTANVALQKQILQDDMPVIGELVAAQFGFKPTISLRVGREQVIDPSRLRQAIEDMVQPEDRDLAERIYDFVDAKIDAGLLPFRADVIEEFSAELTTSKPWLLAQAIGLESDADKVGELYDELLATCYAADILVINHHLLSLNLLRNFLWDEDRPVYLVVDEADQLPEIVEAVNRLSLPLHKLERIEADFPGFAGRCRGM